MNWTLFILFGVVDIMSVFLLFCLFLFGIELIKEIRHDVLYGLLGIVTLIGVAVCGWAFYVFNRIALGWLL